MAVDFFLKLEGIDGESADSNHKNEITVLSWSWGASQTSSVAGTGGSGAGKASLSEISIMKNFDKASPKLLNSLLKGTHITSGVLTANKSAGEDSGKPFITVTFTEMFVTSQQLSGSSEVPTESVSFSYNTMKMEYSTQNEAGTLTSVTPVSYDLKANKVS